VVVCNTSRDPGTERRYVTALREYRADAIIFIGGDIFDAATRRALERELATLPEHGAVAIAVAGDHADLPAIDIDHAAAAEEMVRYLVGLGHTRIGYVAGPSLVSTARHRLRGFVSGMAAAGLASDLVIESDFTYSGGQAAAARLLESNPSAIFAANDQMALGTLAACRAAGVAVPGDVTVVGFGNTSAAEHAVPPLTTVFMPRHQLGVEAMQAVLDAFELEVPRIYPRRLPFHLVIRESSAPPVGARRGNSYASF
jgi:LacI family transcriptional regulator